jgi:aspartate carbamoyltransferase catalytic subunit
LAIITPDQYQPTAASFLIAAQKLGCNQIQMISDPTTPPASSTDILVVCHPDLPQTQKVIDFLPNAKVIWGRTADQNPSEALAALWTIFRQYQRLDNLKLTTVGTNPEVWSLMLLIGAVSQNSNITALTSPGVIPHYIANSLQKAGAPLREVKSLADVTGHSDVVCLSDPDLTVDELRQELGGNHPFILELGPNQNSQPDLQTVAYRQEQNGLYIRMALLASLAK